jgi:Ca2+-binding RTX toxin-like protein
VTVNLPAGTATGTNGVTGINKVIGGAASDTIAIDDNLGKHHRRRRLRGRYRRSRPLRRIGRSHDHLQCRRSISVSDGTNDLTVTSKIERIVGGSGNNTFAFEDGATFAGTIDGGTGGTNTLDYSAYATAVTVNLSTGAATGIGGGAAGKFSNIRNVTGGSGADTLTGDANANVLAGGAGNDTLSGGAGDDTYVFAAGGGTDTISDAGGSDTLDYSAYTTAVAVSLAAGTATGVTSGFSNIENVTGGSGNDTITGDANANIINGGAGNDTLTGGPATTPMSSKTAGGPIQSPIPTHRRLDFSAVTAVLMHTISGSGTVSVTDGTNALSGITGMEASPAARGATASPLPPRRPSPAPSTAGRGRTPSTTPLIRRRSSWTWEPGRPWPPRSPPPSATFRT